jgi:cytochrome c553
MPNRCAAILTLAAMAAALPGQTHAAWAGLAPVLDRSCIDCHGGDTTKGSFDLSKPADDPAERLWAIARVRERVRTGEMPPPQADALSAGDRQQLLHWCGQQLAEILPRLPWPAGRVTIRRLSRTQWQNSVRDLFSVQTPLALGFPNDDLGYGFDNIGDALSFSTLHLEKYLAAAADVAQMLLEDRDPTNPRRQTFAPSAFALPAGAPVTERGNGLSFLSRATAQQRVVLPREGQYRIELSASGDQGGDEPPKLVLGWNERTLTTFAVPNRRPQPFVWNTNLPGGAHSLTVTFPNDFYQPAHPEPRQRDRNLHLHSISVVGPLDIVPRPNAEWLFAADPGGEDLTRRAATMLPVLLQRIYRRPPRDEEVGRMVALVRAAVNDGEPWPVALAPALQAALCSPHFLFRMEATAPASTRPKRNEGLNGDQPLDGYAIASRLAGLLWSSTPDAELLADAAAGRLAEANGLRAATERCLRDPRANALVTDFATQWLELRALAERTPDPIRFPEWDAGLLTAMRQETELLLLTIFREERDVRELIDCDFTHLDARLAAHYGMERPPMADPAEFVRVPLHGAHRLRSGLLGHGSILTLTSNPTRTSPVKRGKWILENMLGAPPPAPEPGSDSFANEASIDSSASLREQLELHRASARCAGCHVRMDALGFALEHYDPIGRARSQDTGGAIDARGALPDGQQIDGLAGLKAVLREDPALVRTLLRKLFVYGVGREPRHIDLLQLDAAADAAMARGKVSLQTLVHLVVQSPPFSRTTPSR